MRSIPFFRELLLSFALLAACLLLAAPPAAADDTGKCPAAAIDLGTSLEEILSPNPIPANSCPAFCTSTYDCEVACPGMGATCNLSTRQCEVDGSGGPPPGCQGCTLFCLTNADCAECPNDGCTYTCQGWQCLAT